MIILNKNLKKKDIFNLRQSATHIAHFHGENKSCVGESLTCVGVETTTFIDGDGVVTPIAYLYVKHDNELKAVFATAKSFSASITQLGEYFNDELTSGSLTVKIVEAEISNNRSVYNILVE